MTECLCGRTECFGAGESPLAICHGVPNGERYDGYSRPPFKSRVTASDPVSYFSHRYRPTAGIPRSLQSNYAIKFNSKKKIHKKIDIFHQNLMFFNQNL